MSDPPPRSERLERQKRDEKETGTVYYTGRAPGNHYHEDPDCRYVNKELVPISREDAKRRWLSPCKGCVLDD